MEYQCSVFCHCSNPSIRVDCYGDFEYQEGTCSICGAIHIGRQIPSVVFGKSKHKYVTEIKHTLRSRIMYAKTEVEFLLHKTP
jgi:hypothetical protein